MSQSDIRRRAFSEEDDSAYSKNSDNQEHTIDSCSDNEKSTDSYRNTEDNTSPPEEGHREPFAWNDSKDNSVVDKEQFFCHNDRQAGASTISPSNHGEIYGRYKC